MDNTIYCFTKNLICHHDDYFEVVNSFKKAENVKTFWRKIKILFSRKKIIFMDIDTRDLKFVPLMILRSIWGAKSIAISVSTEYLKNERTFLEFITNSGRNLYLRSVRNRLLFKLIKNYSKTEIYSIHKNSENNDYFKGYVKGFFYDPQLWDIDFFKNKVEQPKELEFLPEPIENYILFLGSFDERRSRSEFLNYIKSNKDYYFLLACKTTDEDEMLLKQIDNVFLINRFINNKELFFLFSKCNVVYTYYTNQRPSGFFGRAMQLNKNIIVRSNSFLSIYFKEYSNLLSISKLEDLHVNVNSTGKIDEFSKKYDDSLIFKQILEAI